MAEADDTAVSVAFSPPPPPPNFSAEVAGTKDEDVVVDKDDETDDSWIVCGEEILYFRGEEEEALETMS